MVSEAIDFRFLLLENYKKLKINEKEFVTLFMIDHFISLGNPFVTADLLSLKMSLDVKEIDKTLVSLLTTTRPYAPSTCWLNSAPYFRHARARNAPTSA